MLKSATAAGTKFLEVHQEHRSFVTIIVILAAYLPGVELFAWETMESVSSSLRPGESQIRSTSLFLVPEESFSFEWPEEGFVFVLGLVFVVLENE